MRQHRLYIANDLSLDQTLELDKDQAHYVGTVLRLKNHELVSLFNGNGYEYRAKLAVNRKAVSVTPFEEVRFVPPKTYHKHLYQCIARGDHMDFAIQKATELNVDIITPVISERTQNHDSARLEKRFQHWQQIIRSACEQSGRCYLPTLNPIIKYDEAIKQCNSDIKLVCNKTDRKFAQSLTGKTISIVIGPEGGLSEDETLLAKDNSFEIMSLGENVLRTETAATSALTILNYLSSN